MSVTKSFVATLAATLVAEGALDETRRVDDYMPELAASGFGDATVRQVMDMQTGIAYSEDYLDPDSGAILDRLEGEVTGTIEITRVREKTAYCKLIDGTMPVRGDRVVLKAK